MGWGKPGQGVDAFGSDRIGVDGQPADARSETIELVGTHLRVSGEVSLAHFGRLSDRINLNRGYIRLKDARLLRRNGEPTPLIVPELMVNPDEITFVGQRAEDMSPAPSVRMADEDRPAISRIRRQVVIFTAGHTLIGTIHTFAETDISSFVDSPDPRFVPMVDVTARSLADRRVISHFALALVNRTEITAASFLELAGGAAETGVAID